MSGGKNVETQKLKNEITTPAISMKKWNCSKRKNQERESEREHKGL